VLFNRFIIYIIFKHLALKSTVRADFNFFYYLNGREKQKGNNKRFNRVFELIIRIYIV